MAAPPEPDVGDKRQVRRWLPGAGKGDVEAGRNASLEGAVV